MALQQQAERDQLREVLSGIGAELAMHEQALSEIDEQLAAREAEYLDSIRPLIEARTAARIARTRAFAAQTALKDPDCFSGTKQHPVDAMGQRLRQLESDLADARERLQGMREPYGDRLGIMLNPDSWRELCEFEAQRDRTMQLESEVRSLRNDYEKRRDLSQDPSHFGPPEHERRRPGHSRKRDFIAAESGSDSITLGANI